jgi:ribonuclease G
MKREIVVNAEDLESRVAIIEDGELSELHVEREPRMVGNIYKARVLSVLPGMDAAFADIGLERNVFLCADDVGFINRDGLTATPAPRSASIAQRLKENQEVVVQIVRAPVGGKGARATTRLALPGRYLVLLLSDEHQVGISRRIEERKERERLRKIGQRLRPKDCGLIIRTEAEGHGRKELEGDLKVLLDLRRRLSKKAAQTKAPALLHQDLTLTYQVIRDVFSDEVQRLVIDSQSAYDNAVELVRTIAPKLRRRIKRYRGKVPIFHKHGIEEEIDQLLRRRVWLQAGGYITIDQTEAFTAIDVNTGRFTGSTKLADTILRTNLEAASEIGRHLRLRDIGGMIVIDFIDMERASHRQRVMKAFEDALKHDRQKTKIMHLSPLGLVEMTRKRRGESLMGILTETCADCAGLGRTRNSLTIALKMERDVQRLAAEKRTKAFVIRTAPSVAAILIGPGGQRAAALEKTAGASVYIRADSRMMGDSHEMTATTPSKADKLVKLHNKGDEVIVSNLEPGDLESGDRAVGWSDGYRVEIEGVGAGKGTHTVVLTEADRSFGRGHVKGKEPARDKEGKPKARRRARRKRSRKPKAQSDSPAAALTAEPASQEPPAPVAEEPPAPAQAKKPGLLRRGARQIARSRR